MPQDKLREMQVERFRHAVARVMSHSTFYRELYESAGVDPEEIRTFEDIRSIPLIDKAGRSSLWQLLSTT
jgi:phenylacetate-CoA ligase